MEEVWVGYSDAPWASFQIRKVVGCACAGNAGNVFPRDRLQRKPLVSDPNMHHGTCVTHVLWCMSGSLTGGRGENVPSIPGACASAILRIWQEAHGLCSWATVHGKYSGQVMGRCETLTVSILLAHECGIRSMSLGLRGVVVLWTAC